MYFSVHLFPLKPAILIQQGFRHFWTHMFKIDYKKPKMFQIHIASFSTQCFRWSSFMTHHVPIYIYIFPSKNTEVWNCIAPFCVKRNCNSTPPLGWWDPLPYPVVPWWMPSPAGMCGRAMRRRWPTSDRSWILLRRLCRKEGMKQRWWREGLWMIMTYSRHTEMEYRSIVDFVYMTWGGDSFCLQFFAAPEWFFYIQFFF